MASFRKTVLTFVLFILMLFLLTVQKSSMFVSLRIVLHQDISIEQGYAVITVLLTAPYLFSLLLTVWNIPFLRKADKWKFPPLTSLLLGLFAALVEAGCTVLFATRIIAQLPVFVGIMVPHGTLSVSSLMTSIKRGKRSKPTEDDIPGINEKPEEGSLAGTFCCNGARIVASVLCLLVFPAVSCFLYVMDLATGVTSLSLTAIPCLLGLVWTKDVQEFIADPSGKNSLFQKRFTVLYIIVKLIGIISFILLELHIRSGVHDETPLRTRLYNGFDVFFDTYALLPLVINFFSCLLGFGVAYLCLAMCQPLFGIVLPSLCSTVTTIILCIGLAPSLYDIEETKFFGSFSQYLICATILTWAWAWPYILKAESFLRKPGYLLTPFDILFREYGWNPICNEQKLLLGYDVRCSHGNNDGGVKVKNRIYICTTMYREADYEMERLLASLVEMSSSDHLKDVHLESNVFMDNGCSGGKLNEFALQFIGLLVNKAGVQLEKARCCVTPYGMQIFCKLSSGLPMFLHLKDPKKVKSKKRWSQAMYINYVMRFRKTRWLNDYNYRPVTVSSTIQDKNIVFEEKGDVFAEIRLHDNKGDFSLRQISNIGYPTLVTFKHGADSDQGFSSVDESITPQSDKSPVSGSSKESSDLDSLTDDTKSPGAFCNPGFEPDDDDEVLNYNATPVDDYGEVFLDQSAQVDDDHTYILATDADMDFKSEAVKELLDLCSGDKRVGAACGRTHPIGKKRSIIVWHQVFEYAKDFWMIKNAQNIIGSVSCCPGCFSLYRASALRDVMDKYSSPTRSPYTVYVKDTGEDRWMATLMMINGWRMRYSPFADNTTYCPDTFQEYYKQRKRWILSDLANAVLVVQNIFRLIRNNECFSFVYVIYLINMFLNNVITPGTAIVMITAGLELVFEVPYIYTTIPITLMVYMYAFLCTCTSVRTQGIITSLITVVMGGLFASVAIFGSYKITWAMIQQIHRDAFHFQQHYVILLLALSLVYAALMHPMESYQIIYGVAYLFIFPAMHVLLPIYSIANIVDQSWGTRDSNTASLPKLRCMPSLKQIRRRFKKKHVDMKEDTTTQVQSIVSALTNEMSEGNEERRQENAFWENLIANRLGNDVNKGLEKEALAAELRKLRNRSLGGFMFINAAWLVFLSYFFMGLDSPLSRLNIYGVISGALYGFTLIIQTVGLTVERVKQVVKRVAKYIYGDSIPVWVCEREKICK